MKHIKNAIHDIECFLKEQSIIITQKEYTYTYSSSGNNYILRLCFFTSQDFNQDELDYKIKEFLYNYILQNGYRVVPQVEVYYAR